MEKNDASDKKVTATIKTPFSEQAFSGNLGCVLVMTSETDETRQWEGGMYGENANESALVEMCKIFAEKISPELSPQANIVLLKELQDILLEELSRAGIDIRILRSSDVSSVFDLMGEEEW